MQRGLLQMLSGSAEAAGLCRAAWDCQKGGDGELAILPPGEPENVVVDDFIRELSDRLDDYNHDLVEAARLRLRLAVHHGVVVPADNGYAGEGVVAVSRLVGCVPLRQAQLAAPDANLVVIFSNRVYLDTIAQRFTKLRSSQLRRVVVQVKENCTEAWLYVPGHNVHELEL